MRNLTLPLLALLGAASAAAQSKVSPRVAASAGGAYIVQFRPGADMTAAREWLKENGFDLLEHPDLRPGDLLAAGPAARIADVVGDDEVVYVLPASPDLASRQRVMACSGPVTVQGAAASYTAAVGAWSRDASGAAALHYFIQSLTAKLEANAARGEIERAFREWEKYGNVTLTPGDAPDSPRTVTVGFFQGAHGDGLPFDGPGGSLAHTYYPAPPNPEPVAGDMHLDADEDWHIGGSIDLYTVVLHETGHALGLGHSDQPGAVMYPYYRLAAGLTTEDITAIQNVYGPAVKSGGAAPPVTPPVVPPPPPPPPPNPPPPTPPAAPDRTPPALRIASPATNTVVTTASSIAIGGSASDDTGVVSVKWTTSTGDSGLAAGTASWSATVPLYVGNTVVVVRAYDAAGNSAWRALTVTRR